MKEADDLMDATRYGIMSLRFARPDAGRQAMPADPAGPAADSWMG